MNEDELIQKLKTYTENGILKRIGVILYHRKAGFNANAMVVWKIDDEDLDNVGKYMESFSEVAIVMKENHAVLGIITFIQ